MTTKDDDDLYIASDTTKQRGLLCAYAGQGAPGAFVSGSNTGQAGAPPLKCNTMLQINSCNTFWSVSIVHVRPDPIRPQPCYPILSRNPSGGSGSAGVVARAAPSRVSMAFFQNKKTPRSQTECQLRPINIQLIVALHELL